MHRDYQANMPTRLYQYDHHIEIMNPGGLYGQARPENFPHVNDYRLKGGVKFRTLQRYISQLQSMGIVVRKDGRKDGHWEIKNKQSMKKYGSKKQI